MGQTEEGGMHLTVVYVDTLFLLNLLLDYLLLRVSARICGQYVPLWRLGLGAGCGALYAVCVFLPGLAFLCHPAVKVMAGVFMALVAYGGRRRFFRLMGVLFACACTLGGGLLVFSLLGQGGLTYGTGIPATGLDLKRLLLAAAGVYLLLTLSMRCLGRYSRLRREIIPVTLVLAGRRVRLDAMVDTGNSLSDPLSDARVMVAEWEAVCPLVSGGTGLSEAVVGEPAACAKALSGLLGPERVRLLPYRAVGVSAGLLPALRVDGADLDGKQVNRLLVAVCPGQLAADGAYTALVGTEP